MAFYNISHEISNNIFPMLIEFKGNDNADIRVKLAKE